MTPDGTIPRPRYREQQSLTAGDLATEQAYLVSMRRRHLIAHHSWGIVEGLRLEREGAQVTLRPGFAVDGYGRELIVPTPVSVPSSTLETIGDKVAAWLVYSLTEAAAHDGGPAGDAACRRARAVEEARLRLTAVEFEIDPRAPVEVPQADLDFPPHLPPPDDPARQWPVFLGMLNKVAGGSYRPDLADRPLAGLVGESIEAPSGRTRVQVGSEDPGDTRRFGVATGAADATWTDRLTVDGNGTLDIRGDAAFHSDLAIADFPPVPPDPPDGVWGATFGEKTVPAAALPWSIYRTLAPATPDTPPPLKQLRFEIGSPDEKGDPKRFALSIGHAEDGEFVPCLSVLADCTVVVRGRLRVEGQLLEGPIPADSSDPRFVAAVLDTWANGVAAGATQVGFLTGAEIQGTIEAPDDVVVDERFEYTLRIRNSGTGRLTNISVFETRVLNEVEVPNPTGKKVEPSDFTLAEGEERVISRAFTPADTGTLRILISMIGLGQANNRVQDQSEREVQVSEEPQVS